MHVWLTLEGSEFQGQGPDTIGIVRRWSEKVSTSVYASVTTKDLQLRVQHISTDS